MISLGNISIKRKLTLIIMAASTVALLLVSGGFVTYELVTFRKTMKRDLSTLAEIIGNRSTAALSFDNREDAEEDLYALTANPRITAACLYKGDKVFARYPRNASPSLFPKPEKDTERFEGKRLILFREIVNKGDSIGTLYVESDLQEMHDRFRLYAIIIVLFMFASLVVTFVLSPLLQRIITKPFFHLAQTAKMFSTKKNYSVRAWRHSHDELGQLIVGVPPGAHRIIFFRRNHFRRLRQMENRLGNDPLQQGRQDKGHDQGSEHEQHNNDCVKPESIVHLLQIRFHVKRPDTVAFVHNFPKQDQTL